MSNTAALVKTKVQGQKLLSPLEQEVAALVVKTAEQYEEADVLLGDIIKAIGAWDAKMEPILKPLREAKQAADALKREIRGPLELLEKQVKERMRAYKILEQRRIEEEQDRLRREEEKRQREMEELARREESARTKQMRERLAAKREALAAEVEEAPPEPVAVQGSFSGTRKVRKVRVVDLEALIRDGILGGHVELAAVLPDLDVIRETSKDWPLGVRCGIEVYEDVVIAGRRR